MRIFAATPRYIQGAGAIARVGDEAARLGSRPGVVIDALIEPMVGPALVRGFAQLPMIARCEGEVTDANAAGLAAQLSGADVIVAVGGGKALDLGKAVALLAGVPIITVPTIASTDGPASSGIAMYDDAHRLIRVDQMPANPAAVIVDSAVIARAPARFLAAGIGDAIAKKFEADGCRAGGGRTKHGTTPTHSALAVADAAYRLLRAHAVGAMAAAARHEVNEDLEATIEAAVLLSAMGFENGGLSIAHSMTRGLMTLRGAKDRLHGEHVGYGTLVHLAVDGRSVEEVHDLAAFLRSVGLPVSLAGLGVTDPDDADFTAIADPVMASPHIGNLGHTIDAAALIAAMKLVEGLEG